MAPPRVHRAGDRAVLVDLAGPAAVQRAAELVRERFGGALEDVVAGHRTLLVSWPQPPADPRVADVLEALGEDPAAPAPERTVTIPVAYDGPDLGRVAELTGLSPEEVVRRHAGTEWRVAFIGFAPGFGYLVGGDPKLAVPRREDPRERVPAGAVGLAGEYSAVYPTASPGGWQLIGRTDERMFDPARRPPALLEPGVAVVFEER